MPAHHDRGGQPTTEPIHQDEHTLADWERRVDALHNVLGEKGIRRTDEMRRAIESLPAEQYESLSYYERWTAALEMLLVEKGIVSVGEIDARMSATERPD